jgi:hypothetical protein
MRVIQLFLAMSLVFGIVGSHTHRVSAAAPTVLTAIATANFAPYRNDIAKKFTTLRGMSDVMSVATFDTLRSTPTNAAYIAQLAFIDAYGVSTLNAHAKPAANKPFLRWLFTTADVIPMLLQGGPPTAAKNAEALAILQRIWMADPASRSGMLRKLAMAVALSNANPVDTGWYRVNASGIADTIDPLSRYQNYKIARAAKKLDAGFDGLSIWHLRMVVGAWARDVDLDWLRTTYAGPHSVVSEAGVTRTFTTTYTRSNIGDSGYELEYRDENIGGGSVQSGSLVFYGPDADIERVLKVGGVCGAIAKYGSTVAQAYGIPAFPVGQPGHAAAFISNAPGAWVMHNDIYGMGASFYHDGTMTPLMSETSEPFLDPDYGMGERNFSPAYVLLYEVLSGPRAATYARSEWLRWAARGVSSAPIRQRLLALAVTAEPLNVMAWRDRIVAANANPRTTTTQWQSMLTGIATAFAGQPRVLSELAARIEPKLIGATTPDATKAAYVGALYRRYDAIPATSQHAAMRDVILAALPEWMRAYLPAPTVSIRFSGENAGTIIGFKTGMAYSVDAGAHWTVPATESFQIPLAQLNTLQSTGTLHVRNRYSTSTDPARAAALGVTTSPNAAPVLVADDRADTLSGMTTAMEYSVNNGKIWTTYTTDDALDLGRAVTYWVRYRGNGTTLPSMAARHVFTKPTDYAVGSTAIAEYGYSGSLASLAVDGSDATSFLPERDVHPAGTPLTVVLDLGQSRTIDTVQLLWTRQKNYYEGYGKAYTIAIANTSNQPAIGSSQWQTVASITSGNGGRDTMPVSTTTARYVLLTITESAGHDAANWRWPALYTFTVSGTDAPPVVGVTPGVQYLSDRLWNGESIYASETGIDNMCEKYQLGGHIQLDGTVYQKGIGLCYNMTLQYHLDGTQTAFVADVGIADQESDSDTRQVMFEVIADSTTVYKSPTMTKATNKQHIDVDITGAKLLTIKYYSVDGDYPPVANWGNAYLR